jgi:hypothetical protein
MSTGIESVARLADGTTGCEMRLMEDFEMGSDVLPDRQGVLRGPFVVFGYSQPRIG